MSKFFKYQREESPLRKNFDSFTSKHKLRDAQEEFSQAIYRFRAAEDADAPDRIALKREMEFLDRKVRFYRYCIYHGQPRDNPSLQANGRRGAVQRAPRLHLPRSWPTEVAVGPPGRSTIAVVVQAW